MAKTVLILFLIVLSSVLTSSASARLLNDHLTLLTENPSQPRKQQVLPYHKGDNTDIQASAVESSRFGAAAAAKYGPLVLNLLPKGTKPPSGPSKGTNELKN